ncbi:MAG: hypothetical protein ACRD33_02785 [Candidatus Acidiferrales bacterium]
MGVIVFVLSFCALVYFTREAWRAFVSPEFKRDLARLRRQRQMRKDARRRS